MSDRARRTKAVFDAIAALGETGTAAFRPGDVATELRSRETPFGAWEVRGEFSKLERLGLIAPDEDFAVWRLIPGASFSIAAAKAVAEDG